MRSKLLLFFLLLMYGCFKLSAQSADSIKLPGLPDSSHSGFSDRIQAFSEKESKQSIEDLESDKAAIAQYKILEQIKGVMQKAKLYLQHGIDTSGIKEKLRLIRHDMAIAGDGVFTNTGTAQTFRNLSATSKILIELLDKVNAQKLRLSAYNSALNHFRYQLDSLSADPMLFKFSKDSAVAVQYLKQLVLVAREINPIDKSLKQSNSSIQLLLNDLSITALNLQNNLDEIAVYKQTLADNSFKREFNNIWDDAGFIRPFKDIFNYSIKKDALTLVFFVEDNKGKVFLMIALIFTSFIYLRGLKKMYIEHGLLQGDFSGKLVLRYPKLSAIVIVINLFQFAFTSPPFLWSLMLWLISAVGLSILLRSYIKRYWMGVWLAMFAFFLLAAGINLMLQASRTERWIMLLTALTGSIVGGLVYVSGNKKTLREQWIIYSIGLMACLELLSCVANGLGRYNLAKSLLISGFLNVVIATMFLWTARLINEGLLLAFNIYRQQDRKLFYLNFQKIGNKVPGYFYVLLAAGWLTLVGRNFPVFEYLELPVSDFFARERTLGSYTFSISSILLFITIIACSVIVSKITSFFATDKHLHTDDKKRQNGKEGIGSWLLLVRIAILSTGLFLAIAAAGIPVDKITIVLGALGVGIGFGLQTLVNNLVSGLIIAFEKPVNVGDWVDVDGQSGMMKSIGFRSSIISTWDGADVVMPNGDLLNAHLVNWSLAGNRKRASILIGIAYDADLNKAKALLADILEADERLAKNPRYVIQYEQFSNSAIDLKIYFWTKHISELPATRSDLIIAINDCFSKNGINIPFPQQDVYVHDANNKPGSSS